MIKIHLYIINNIIASSNRIVIFRKQFLIVVRSLKNPYCRLKLKTNVLEVTIVNYTKLYKIIHNCIKTDNFANYSVLTFSFQSLFSSLSLQVS